VRPTTQPPLQTPEASKLRLQEISWQGLSARGRTQPRRPRHYVPTQKSRAGCHCRLVQPCRVQNEPVPLILRQNHSVCPEGLQSSPLAARLCLVAQPYALLPRLRRTATKTAGTRAVARSARLQRNRRGNGCCTSRSSCRLRADHTNEVEDTDHIALRSAAARECRRIARLRIAALSTCAVNV
jgi:hypothetical protein